MRLGWDGVGPDGRNARRYRRLILPSVAEPTRSLPRMSLKVPKKVTVAGTIRGVDMSTRDERRTSCFTPTRAPRSARRLYRARGQNELEMRTGLSGVGATSAYAVIAATNTATHSPTHLLRQFHAAGFTTTNSPQLTQTVRDHVVVFTALRMDAATTQADQMITFAKIGAHLFLTTRYSGFQPVWDIETWSATGLEILVMDDDDASEQLDALCEGIGADRSSITIKPRTGWQGYGYPEIQALG